MDLTPYTNKAKALFVKHSGIDNDLAAVDIDMMYMLQMSQRPTTVSKEDILPSEICHHQVDESDHYESLLHS
jgi:hypothetical protein